MDLVPNGYAAPYSLFIPFTIFRLLGTILNLLVATLSVSCQATSLVTIFVGGAKYEIGVSVKGSSAFFLPIKNPVCLKNCANCLTRRLLAGLKPPKLLHQSNYFAFPNMSLAQWFITRRLPPDQYSRPHKDGDKDDRQNKNDGRCRRTINVKADVNSRKTREHRHRYGNG